MFYDETLKKDAAFSTDIDTIQALSLIRRGWRRKGRQP